MALKSADLPIGRIVAATVVVTLAGMALLSAGTVLALRWLQGA